MGLGVAVGQTGCSAKVLLGFTLASGTLDEDGPLSLGGLQGQLVKGHDLTTALDDASTSLLSDVKGAHLHFGDLKDSDIIGDGSNDNSDFVLATRLLHQTHQSVDGQRSSVGAAHKESLEDDLVELGIGPSGQEAVKLHQQTEVNILALGSFADYLPLVFMANVDTHFA